MAAAARAAGVRPVVIDCFGDADTHACAAEVVSLSRHPAGWIRIAHARTVMREVWARYPRASLVWGGGMEGYPRLLGGWAPLGAVLGCPIEAVLRLTNPVQRAALLCELAIPHPEISLLPRAELGWLCKRRGGAGGTHVYRYSPGARFAATHYLQREISGQSYSLAFVATVEAALPLSFNAQLNWQPNSKFPFRYGGAVVTPLPASLTAEVVAYATRIVRRCGLRGLCGMDFIVDAEGAVSVLEVNPRPTATFDLGITPARAFSAHLAACGGTPRPTLVPCTAVRGHLIAYAADAIRIANSLDWPPWTADRPRGGVTVPAAAPLCSITAEGSSEAAVRELLAVRLTALESLFAV